MKFVYVCSEFVVCWFVNIIDGFQILYFDSLVFGKRIFLIKVEIYYVLVFGIWCVVGNVFLVIYVEGWIFKKEDGFCFQCQWKGQVMMVLVWMENGWLKRLIDGFWLIGGFEFFFDVMEVWL